MRQDSLFDALPNAPGRQIVRFEEAFEPWRRAALFKISEGRAPDELHWLPELLLRPDNDNPETDPGNEIRVPSRFRRLAHSVSYHRAADRWDLLYRCLWRIANGERHLLDFRADPLVRRLYHDAAAVRRAVHKMHAFVRFRALDDKGGERFVAWFEPDHPIVRHTAGFFRDRFFNTRWSILTPDLCAHWEGSGAVWFSEGVSRDARPAEDRFEEGWRRYYRSIFNPARLKITAMRSEMPQKYWRNLPEAAEIQSLVLNADERVGAMLSAASSDTDFHCGPRPVSYAQQLSDKAATNQADPLASITLALQSCQNCSLWEPATQPVPGEGNPSADIMIIGEQPGDHEDLAGRPFVGPAGRLLDRALAQAGLERSELYLTNAVKHFRFRISGRRRIHERPREREIGACNEWLMHEIGIVDPVTIVCLGVTAASALLGSNQRLSALRGREIEWQERRIVVTIHPAALLRGSDTEGRVFDALVNDLRTAAG